MNHQYVKVKIINEALSLITLNRPERRNALNMGLVEELGSVFEGLHNTASQRVTIINGEGPVFCSGLDLKEAADPALIDKSSELLASTLRIVANSSLIVIAAVHGAVLAGGMGIMAVCDLVLSAPDTKFGLPETRRGLVAAMVAAFMGRQLLDRHLKELLLLGENIDASQALKIGLINRIVSEGSLEAEAIKYAELILKGAPQATRDTKRLLKALEPTELTESMNIAKTFHHKARMSKEALEGAKAFLEKRSPNWESN